MSTVTIKTFCRIAIEEYRRRHKIKIEILKVMRYEILYYFYLELFTRKTAKELNINYRLIHRKFMQFRKLIAEYCDNQAEKLNGELELDESYFGGKRKRKRGRRAKNKAIVFGILEGNGKIYTKIVENVSAETLMNEIQNKTKKGSVFYTDDWKSYASLEQYGKHNVIRRDKDEFAKERFHKYHGIRKIIIQCI